MTGNDYKLLIGRILKLSEEIYRSVKISIPAEWLSSDMTVAQLRVLLFLHSEGPSRMSTIANSIGIAVSSATGIVENLVKKGLVIRRDDPEDRRLVICELSPSGWENINRLFALGQSQMENLLQGLTLDQLQKSAEVAEFLLNNIKSKGSG